MVLTVFPKNYFRETHARSAIGMGVFKMNVDAQSEINNLRRLPVSIEAHFLLTLGSLKVRAGRCRPIEGATGEKTFEYPRGWRGGVSWPFQVRESPEITFTA
jgi:hypothetical protein